MATTLPTGTLSDVERQQLKAFFETTRPLPQLLSTLRSRRVARGYAIETGEPEVRSATGGRTLRQEKGPLAFKSEHAVLPLTEVEEAILTWSALGPNGIAHWDIAVHGGFHELTWIAGRTAAAPGNSQAHDLLVIKDEGVFVYNPGLERSKLVEIESEQDYAKILTWYRQGMHRVLDRRPDVDWGLRVPGAPNASLFGPYQFNVNREGTTWFIPVTDVGWLYFSVLLNLFDVWHLYFVDDATGKPAGVDGWVGEGKLEFPVTISQIEQFLFQVETYPPGSYVQNMRLAAESMGLGNWIFCGFFDDVLMGAFPDVAKGLGFRSEPLNAKAPLASGALKIFGVEGVKEATYVPSPRYADGRAVITHMIEEKYGSGGTLARNGDNWMTRSGPFKPEVVREIVNDPAVQVSDWAVDAAIAYVNYCVDRYGQCPVYFNPMQCNFGAVIHHVDEAFYERYYRGGGNITPQIREHMATWH
jgi:hypothetical protein